MKYIVTGEKSLFYELEIEAAAQKEALSIARQVINEGTSPPSLLSFYSNEPAPLLLEVEEEKP